MSLVMVKVTGTPEPPFESSEVVKGHAAAAVQAAARQRVKWECSYGCHGIVTDDGMYRQLNPKCARHRSLIPARVTA